MAPGGKTISLTTPGEAKGDPVRELCFNIPEDEAKTGSWLLYMINCSWSSIWYLRWSSIWEAIKEKEEKNQMDFPDYFLGYSRAL